MKIRFEAEKSFDFGIHLGFDIYGHRHGFVESDVGLFGSGQGPVHWHIEIYFLKWFFGVVLGQEDPPEDEEE